MRELTFIILLFIFSLSQTLGQENDSVTIMQDTTLSTSPVEDTKKKARRLNLKPIQVGALSAILPGAGQIYNRKYWKLPLVYGGVAGIAYLINYNTVEYRKFKLAYAQRLAGEPDIYLSQISTAEGIKTYRDRFRKNLEMSYIGAIGVFVLVGVDAFIDAHLAGYDVSDDLTFDFISMPIGDPNFGATTSVGLGLSFTF